MIKIFVVCHKPAYVLKNDLLIPVQVGAAAAKERIPGMEYDDNGDNISAKNSWYCELTAQYWAWKNVKADYYGFFHYRRYLTFGEVYPVDNAGNLEKKKRFQSYYEVEDIREDLSKYCFDAETMEKVILKYDFVTVLRERINVTVYDQFIQYHEKDAIDAVIRILKDSFPEYTSAADEYLNSKNIYYMNMFVMRREIFYEYSEWLFTILGEFENGREFKGLKMGQQRVMGYLAERLLGIFYVYKRRQGAVCAEVPYLKFYHTSFADTDSDTSNIRKFQLKPTKFEVNIDMRKFNKLFPAGSKRRLILRTIFLK